MNENDNYLKEIWLAIQEWIDGGYSVLLCRAEDEMVKGRLKKAKSPLSHTWSSDPNQRLSLHELSRIISRHPHTKIAIGIICGPASGNLEVLDIDCKHWPGINTKFFVTLQQTFPELFAKLRIHQTPSTGNHIPYRCEEPIGEGNAKLAYKEGEKEAGIETRGQGGYFIVPPTIGYSVFKNVPIPTLTRAERDIIVNTGRMFDEKQKKHVSPSSKQYKNNFILDPFDDFNASPEGSQVLIQNGWQLDTDTPIFTYYTRPGKDAGKSASYNKEKNCYYNFTSSTDLEPSKGYSPSALLCHLQFNGDYKLLYRHLTERGFGKLKPEYESKCVKKYAETGKELPKYFSNDAKEALVKAVQERNEKYPFGTYWEYIPDIDGYMIHRELLMQFMIDIGLCVHNGEPCIVEGQFIRKLNEKKKRYGARDIFGILNNWIKEDDKTVFNKIRHEFSKFWQYHGEHMIGLLPELDTKRILKPNAKGCYKFFENTILEITTNGKKEIPYAEKFEYLIWTNDVIPRSWKYVSKEMQKKCMYGDYLSKAINTPQEYIQLVIGYLCCGYKISSESYLIALLEPFEASLGGGTGKGFFVKILRFWTGVLVRNGIAVKKDIDQLLQNWDNQEIVHLSDLPKGINLGHLKHLVSDDSQLKKLYKDLMNIPAEEMPKFVVSGQFGLNVEDDGGVKRRLRMVSFNGFLHGHDSIRRVYGGECPEIWTEDDWNGYFSILADAVQTFLCVRSLDLFEDRELWLKGYDARFSFDDSYLRDEIDDQIEEWCNLPFVTSNEISEWYKKICDKNRVPIYERIVGMRRLHKAIKEYSELNGEYHYEYGKTRQVVKNSKQWVVIVRKIQ